MTKWFLVAAALLAPPLSSPLGDAAPPAPAPAVPHAVGPPADTAHLGRYVWPTDASRRITSTFAEYRTAHFHGGIDISTNGVKGYRVFAVREGYVYKVRITPNGYGKMLFIKHPDGYVSTYAHLMGFSEAITKRVRQEQLRRGTYAVDLTLDSAALPVRQGDVVAYTGDSGFGPPHLHFEMRDSNLDAVNPFLFPGFAVEDHIPPRIRRLMIAPLTGISTVENGPHPRYFSRFPRSRRQLLIPGSVRVHGLIGIAVDAEDLSEGTYSRAGIHRMELFVDDSLAFSMELDHVPAEETKQIDLAYDYASVSEGRGRFQKLYIDTGNVLPFYDRRPVGAGVINTELLAEGEHPYRIVCYDRADNAVELRGTLLANHRPAIRFVSADAEEVVVSGTNLASVQKVYLYGKRAFQPNWTQHTMIRGKFEIDGTGMELPIDTRPYDVVKIVAETQWGSQSPPIFHFVKKPLGPPRDIHIDAEIHDSHVRLTLTTPGVFTEPPSLSVLEQDGPHEVELEAVDVARYTGVYIPGKISGACVVHATGEVNGRSVTADDELSMYVISSRQRGWIGFDDGKLAVAFDSGAVYRPLCLQIGRDAERRATVYALSPDDVLLDGGLRLTLAIPPHASGDRPGLYYRTGGAWAYRTGTPDSGGATFSTTVSRLLGDVAVLTDNNPPAIGRFRAVQRRGYIEGAFRYGDDLSGVDPDEIKLYLDGTPVIPEIDGEHRRATFRSDEPAGRGKHLLRLTMQDRAGNTSELTRTISVR